MEIRKLRDDVSGKWKTASAEKIGYIVRLLEILQLGSGDFIGKDMNKILFTKSTPTPSLLNFTQMLVLEDSFWKDIPKKIEFPNKNKQNELLTSFFGDENAEEFLSLETKDIREQLELFLALCDQVDEPID